MEINPVLPLKAARRYAIANVKWFLAHPDTIDLIMVSFTFAMWRHLILRASSPFTSFRLAKFGWVPLLPFADLRVYTPGNEAERGIYGGYLKPPIVL